MSEQEKPTGTPEQLPVEKITELLLPHCREAYINGKVVKGGRYYTALIEDWIFDILLLLLCVALGLLIGVNLRC